MWVIAEFAGLVSGWSVRAMLLPHLDMLCTVLSFDIVFACNRIFFRCRICMIEGIVIMFQLLANLYEVKSGTMSSISVVTPTLLQLDETHRGNSLVLKALELEEVI